MPGKGIFSGFYWHQEFHNVDPKKEKAADCIYLSKDRICQKRGCERHDEKCFDATVCRHRVREKDAKKTGQIKTEWKCSLPPGCTVFSKTQGVGQYIGCDKDYHLIVVKFDDCIQRYMYPDVFVNHQLYGNQEVTDCVQADTHE